MEIIKKYWKLGSDVFIISSKEFVKRTGQIPWQRAEFRWEIISSRGDPQSRTRERRA